jgi:hypothetical protein
MVKDKGDNLTLTLKNSQGIINRASRVKNRPRIKVIELLMERCIIRRILQAEHRKIMISTIIPDLVILRIEGRQVLILTLFLTQSTVK